MTIVSNCGHNEYGGITGGQPGDQTGTEYCLIPWGYYGQNVVFRHPNPIVQAKIAELARKAAENDMVGYDQDDRLSFWYRLQESWFDPALIDTPCNGDCASSSAAIFRAVGVLLNDDALAGIDIEMTTYVEEPILTAAGFIALHDPAYTQTDVNLIPGDVICRTDQHTNIVVEADGPAWSYDADVAYMQRLLNIQLARRGWDPIVEDGSYGPITAVQLIRLTQDWMLNCLDPTVLISGDWYTGWIAALNLHPIRQGMQCIAAWCVKAALIGLGYKGAPLNPDNWEFTVELANMVKQYQTDKGLTATGKVDSDTWFAMTHWD